MASCFSPLRGFGGYFPSKLSCGVPLGAEVPSQCFLGPGLRQSPHKTSCSHLASQIPNKEVTTTKSLLYNHRPLFRPSRFTSPALIPASYQRVPIKHPVIVQNFPFHFAILRTDGSAGANRVERFSTCDLPTTTREARLKGHMT